MSAVISRPMQDACFRDVTWLNGDRLVLVTRAGCITLASPSDVLDEWDVRGITGSRSSKLSDKPRHNLQDHNKDSPPSTAGNDTDNGIDGASSTSWLPTAGGMDLDGLATELNVVVAHERGFFVGGSHGQVLVFEQGGRGGGAGGGKVAGGRRGSGKDFYSLTRIVCVCGGFADVVELRPAEGLGYRWVRKRCLLTLELFDDNVHRKVRACAASQRTSERFHHRTVACNVCLKRAVEKTMLETPCPCNYYLWHTARTTSSFRVSSRFYSP